MKRNIIKISSLISAIVLFASISVNAEGDRLTSELEKKNNETNKLETTENSNMNDASFISPPASMYWMIEEEETELKVENYKDMKEIIPFWMVIEKEPELEVLDLDLD